MTNSASRNNDIHETKESLHMATSWSNDYRRNDQRFGAVDEEAVRRRRHSAAFWKSPRCRTRRGRRYIDVNIGPRSPEFMAEMVEKIQGVTAKPLSIDTPDPVIAEAGLKAYDLARAGGKKPIINSISALRAGMFDLYKIQPFKPILLVSENVVDGRSKPCHTAQETFEAAHQSGEDVPHPLPRRDERRLHHRPRHRPDRQRFGGQHPPADRRDGDDPRRPDFFDGFHASVGLSNFTVMLPPKRPDGSPVKGALESAFLTKAMPLGLDMVIGSVKRNYEKLAPDHPAMMCLEECLKLKGFDVLMRVREFYTS